MRFTRTLALGGLLLSSACGGGGGGGGVNGLAFAGTLTVTSAGPAPDNTVCGTTTRITFTADGADLHTPSLAGGDCLQFVNADATGTTHKPEAFGATLCSQLDGPILARDASFTTVPFNVAKTCQWIDALHPPSSGGGGGGGGY